MLAAFRTLVIVAVVALLTASAMPLEQPISIEVDQRSLPPPWMLLASALLLGAISILVSAVGLLLLKRWALRTGVVGAVLLCIALQPVPVIGIGMRPGPTGLALYVLFAAAWVVALLMARSKALGAKFA